MVNHSEQVKSNKKLIDTEIINYIKPYKSIVLWGASYLGIPIGKKLQEQGIKIDFYWDLRSEELGTVNGIRVVQPFLCDNAKDTLVIICIGNTDLRAALIRQLEARQFNNILRGEYLHSLYQTALTDEYKYEGDVNPHEMTNLERIAKAIDYAIETDYGIWNRQFYAIERLRLSENICFFGDEDLFQFCKIHCIKNNGITNVRYICDMNSENHSKNIEGVSYIDLDEFLKIESPRAIIGDYDIGLSRRLHEMNIESYFFGDLFLNVFSPHHGKEWFVEQRAQILAAYDLFEDEQSKEIYTEALCGRIAPYLATKAFSELCSAGEYFNREIFEFSDSESFVDAGAFMGDSIDGFISAVNKKFEKIYSFELDSDTFEILKKNASKHNTKKIELFNKGIYNQNKTISWTGSDGGMHISENADKFAEVVRLDDFLKGKRITFIKMDIEGSEIAALEGAGNIISSQQPKLAISVYHLLHDLWEIPTLIKELNSDYKIYLRHHSPWVWDTDCYAY